MRQVDVVLGVLTLVAFGMGYAAYRAWHPDPVATEPVVTAPVADSRRVESRPPYVVRDALSDMATSILPRQAGSEGGVRCWQGVLYRQTRARWEPVVGSSGEIAQCEIQAEPVRPQNSEASVQTP